MRVAVIGAGFVGLTTAACIAEMGNVVVCSDVNAWRIQQLRNGNLPFYEANLAEMIQTNTKCERLSFTVNNQEALYQAEVVFVCLPTPSGSNGSADTSSIESFFETYRSFFAPNAIIVMKSTVPIGSSNKFEFLLQREDCEYVSNPEFLREGQAVTDFMNPDRIVLGSSSKRAIAVMKKLYGEGSAAVIETTTTSAEMIKYAANGYLSLKISFINEIAALCEAAQANVCDVSVGIGLDPRIGSAFLRPGPGWGGSCFPKDTSELVQFGLKNGIHLRTIQAAIDVNDDQQRRIVQKILQFGPTERFHVGVLGLAFKAGTDDLRESPSLKIINRLISIGASVVAYDPIVKDSALATAAGFRVAESWEEAVDKADVIAVLTEWEHFLEIDPRKAAQRVRQRNVVDARNVLSTDKWREAGFTYVGVGI